MKALKSVNYKYVMLIGLGIASVVVQSWTLAIALVCFSALHGYELWVSTLKSADLTEEVKKDLAEVKAYVSTVTMSRAARGTSSKPESFF